ncbi:MULTISPECIES: hypothetical protein [Actinomyces]|uniref:Evolved beta-galactosidase subunit beta n=1 Tax=Actinomyces respiraculi TaxID=2744574 RepID=A0A7T0LM89_9ACTO|nr:MULTISPECIES: hypothetical protein [Actinomyces]QPL06285.1 hypothetical protein ID810_05130 [Actinomyces respiraculi]
MRVFTDLGQVRTLLAGTKKWDRALQAIEAATRAPTGIAFSVGDSLTWRRIDAGERETDLVLRRRYQRVVHCLAGSVSIDVSRCTRPVGPYSDLNDRQAVSAVEGTRTTCVITAGQTVRVDIDEATRLVPSDDFDGVLLHLTVEGRSLPNK